jgi:hypothetical protein
VASASAASPSAACDVSKPLPRRRASSAMREPASSSTTRMRWQVCVWSRASVPRPFAPSLTPVMTDADIDTALSRGCAARCGPRAATRGLRADAGCRRSSRVCSTPGRKAKSVLTRPRAGGLLSPCAVARGRCRSPARSRRRARQRSRQQPGRHGPACAKLCGVDVRAQHARRWRLFRAQPLHTTVARSHRPARLAR